MEDRLGAVETEASLSHKVPVQPINVRMYEATSGS